jgi:hypothetical protein
MAELGFFAIVILDCSGLFLYNGFMPQDDLWALAHSLEQRRATRKFIESLGALAHAKAQILQQGQVGLRQNWRPERLRPLESGERRLPENAALALFRGKQALARSFVFFNLGYSC